MEENKYIIQEQKAKEIVKQLSDMFLIIINAAIEEELISRKYGR